MRSRKTAAVTIFVFFLAFFGLNTTAKSATIEQTVTAVRQHTPSLNLSDLQVSTQNQIICLALNQYHEARGSTEADIKAVGFSTRNRVQKSSHNDYCETIWERGQYIWTTRAVSGIIPKEKAAWERMIALATQIVVNDELADTTGGADSFFSRKLGMPRWAARSPIKLPIGGHIYVRLRR